MLKEKAAYYYREEKKSCSEAMLLGARDAYGLQITEGEVALFAGFRTGMGCKSTCGALLGGIGVLSRMYAGREDLPSICGGFVSAFREALGCDSLDCEILAGRYKTEEKRCADTVSLCAEALSNYISLQQEKDAAEA